MCMPYNWLIWYIRYKNKNRMTRGKATDIELKKDIQDIIDKTVDCTMMRVSVGSKMIRAVVNKDEEVVLRFNMVMENILGKDNLTITLLKVNERYRGKGIATKLLTNLKIDGTTIYLFQAVSYDMYKVCEKIGLERVNLTEINNKTFSRDDVNTNWRYYDKDYGDYRIS